MDYNVKLATNCDAEEMLVYLKKVGSETDNLLFGQEGVPLTVEQEEAFLEKVNKTPYSRMFVVRSDNHIIANGYIHTNPRDRIKHKAEIAISVLKSYWGKGVAHLLMKTLLDYAKETSFTETVYLEVISENKRAIKLYEKFGLITYGINERAIKINSCYYDWNLMRLDIK
ncbi:MAG: GNAT family N-acetyltransferase [Tenericutes bacterium]|jgi:RimJ/RimL family protein N-acetyltransferase|nr:GNAT family N-acetyltransferase [Mycoplasmatota bacterium]